MMHMFSWGAYYVFGGTKKCILAQKCAVEKLNVGSSEMFQVMETVAEEFSKYLPSVGAKCDTQRVTEMGAKSQVPSVKTAKCSDWGEELEAQEQPYEDLKEVADRSRC